MTQSLDRAHELLRKAAAQFRFYEAQHRNKIGAKYLSGTPKADDTLAKAEVNAALAFEIEHYLGGEPDYVIRLKAEHAGWLAELHIENPKPSPGDPLGQRGYVAVKRLDGSGDYIVVIDEIDEQILTHALDILSRGGGTQAQPITPIVPGDIHEAVAAQINGEPLPEPGASEGLTS